MAGNVGPLFSGDGGGAPLDSERRPERVHLLLVGRIGTDDALVVGRLRASGYEIRIASSGEEGIALAEQRLPDLVIVDQELPDMKPRNLCKLFLRLHEHIAIIVVADGADQKDVARWLDSGVEDCVSDRTALVEILARVRRTLRTRGRDSGEEIAAIEVGGLRIDIDAYSVTLADTALTLTPREFRMLVVLARHAGSTLTYQRLLLDVWGETSQTNAGLSKLRSAMTRLRNAIAAVGNDPVVMNIPRIGYRLSTLTDRSVVGSVPEGA